MMIDSLGNIIYVGKAKNLKNRASQYFKNQQDRAPKIAEMIHNIHTLNYIVTDTELDGFIEECHLIKEIKPRYNKQQGASYLTFGGAPCFCSAGLRVATSASKELF